LLPQVGKIIRAKWPEFAEYLISVFPEHEDHFEQQEIEEAVLKSYGRY
jgi:hypothetical protein